MLRRTTRKKNGVSSGPWGVGKVLLRNSEQQQPYNEAPKYYVLGALRSLRRF